MRIEGRRGIGGQLWREYIGMKSRGKEKRAIKGKERARGEEKKEERVIGTEENGKEKGLNIIYHIQRGEGVDEVKEGLETRG